MMYPTTSPALGPWADRLQRAAWRGLPFAMAQNSVKPGRRTVLHEYAYRDTPWVEDLGLATITLSISGFLIGDDVFDQRDAMRDACDQPGVGVFMHPSLGPLLGNVIAPSFAETIIGRRVAFEFTFIQTDIDQPIFPGIEIATQGNVLLSALAAGIAFVRDFVATVRGAVAFGIAVVHGVIAVVTGFVATVVGTARAIAHLVTSVIQLPGMILGTILAETHAIAGMVNDAGAMVGAALGLVPPSGSYYGRYGSTGLSVLLPPSATVDSQLAAGVAAKDACDAAMAACLTIAASDPVSLPAAVQAGVAALVASIPSPADQLRLLATLAAFRTGPPPVAASAIGLASGLAQGAVAALVRRSALSALARAETAYQPTSYDDAVATRESITAVLDAEILVAGTNADDTTFLALKALRATIVLDLVTRGAALPRLVTVKRAVALPSLALAWELYGDASRSDDLIARVDPPHPGFMPISFQALSY